MIFEVVLRDPRIPGSARRYLETKFARFRRLEQHVESLRAFLSTEHARTRVELVASIEHHGKIVVVVKHAKVDAAIDLAVDRLELQLAKGKEKRIERSRRRTRVKAPSES